MNHLMVEAARAHADHQVGVHGRTLDRRARLKLWSQFHDAALALLVGYEEVVQSRRIRERDSALEDLPINGG